VQSGRLFTVQRFRAKIQGFGVQEIRNRSE